MTGLSPAIAARLRAAPYRILVTGCSGWLGKATVELLHDAFGERFHDRVRCFGSNHRILTLSGATTFEQQPLDELANLPCAPSLLVHLAFLTKDRAEQMDDDAYRAANCKISRTVLDTLDRVGVEAAFVASSGAAALADDLGVSPAMRLYGSLKRADEEAFTAWALSSGKSAVLGRIHNLSGPHINKLGTYALASFIVDALAGGPIAIRASHDVVRGYVAIRELMSLVFGLLLDGKPGTVRFDSGGEPVELGRLAEAVAAHFGGCPIERPERGSGVDRYLGDETGYRALLEAHGIESITLARQIAETVEFIALDQPDLLQTAMVGKVEP